MPAVKSVSAYVLFLSLFCLLASCKKDELTGSLKIILKGNPPADLTYQLYTEGSWAAASISQPLRTGIFFARTATINDLNPGNYIIMIGGGYFSVQVTAGREREYQL